MTYFDKFSYLSRSNCYETSLFVSIFCLLFFVRIKCPGQSNSRKTSEYIEELSKPVKLTEHYFGIRLQGLSNLNFDERYRMSPAIPMRFIMLNGYFSLGVSMIRDKGKGFRWDNSLNTMHAKLIPLMIEVDLVR